MNTTLRFHQYGDPSVLQIEDDAIGTPSAGEVRLRHEAIGVNFIDTAFRQGIFPVPLPSVPGVEGVGIVEATGAGVTGIEVGQRMAYFLAPGSYTQQRLIAAEHLVPVPDDLSAEIVAALLTKGLTAWAGMNGYYPLQAGQTVLIQGASSSVGNLLARWAKARGAIVIGTAGSPEKLAALASAIDHALPSGAPDLAAQVKRVAPHGVDVVYEFVGKATFAATVAAVRDGGTIVTIGAASGAPEFDKAELARRRIHMVGGPMANHLQGRVGEATQAVFDAYRRGVFGAVTATRYALKDAAQAHTDIARRQKAGSLVLIP
ncbi:quinone oxidoreductase [Pandoraea sp. PE-S2R-1]|uniref:quinone oxidoreductase family protein n=1 Tax=Pandoraea sp. PE-S2R-1 TaxID=1986994 RepID=UPI000B3F9E96|nr:quinone oxidoreductase [Pandoraea sp. PE-S2R-1]